MVFSNLCFISFPSPQPYPPSATFSSFFPFVSSFLGLFFFFIAHLSVCLPQYLFYPFFVSFLLLRFYPWLHTQTHIRVCHAYVHIYTLKARKFAWTRMCSLCLPRFESLNLIYFPNPSIRTSFEILSHPIRAVSSRNVTTDATEDTGEEKP